ncbi:hypothetical protein SAMN05660841_02042 [Sphingobacterium nematocida]|uniref:Uncharacterized protein n=1 Tax=Sphingobacterium nematocida TaxID=1513896 RepID=A0A1T5DKI6_9SPHI|nr:hypothetical protein [Sphingobacterium nematocida]SKB72205.1 hypothetical protein SAMN05660841_02042 [Sphingobacterium nematocida]
MKRTASIAVAVVLLLIVSCNNKKTTSSQKGESVKKTARNIFYFDPKNGNYLAIHFSPSAQTFMTDSTFRILTVNNRNKPNIKVYSGEVQDTSIFIDWRDYSVDTISQFEPAMGGPPDFKYDIRRKIERKGNKVVKYRSYANFIK